MNPYDKNVLKHISQMNKLVRDLKPALDFHSKVSQSVPSSIMDMISNDYLIEAFSNENLKNLASNQNILEAISKNQKALELVSKYRLADYRVSRDTSEDVSNTSSKIICELETQELPNDSVKNLETLKQFLASTKNMSPLDIIAIVSLLISIIGLVYNMMPNSQLTNIENSLDTLIEAQEKETYLLEQQQLSAPIPSIEQEFEQFYPKPD